MAKKVTLEDLLKSGPTVSATSSKKALTTFEGTPPTPPRYFEEDVMRPRTRGWSALQIADLQARMVRAGFLKAKDFRLGSWDPESVDAYADLLTFANDSGSLASDILEEMEAAGAGLSPTRSERGPLVTRTTNPEDLRRVFDATARSLIGKKMDPARLERMVNAYISSEVGEQSALYGAAETGGRVTQAASPQAFAEAALREEAPGEVGAQGFAEQSNEFFDLLGGIGG